MSVLRINHTKDEQQTGGDIAIIGMACLFPGAPDLDTYWQNIISKVDAVTDPPPESWDPAVFYDPESDSNDRVYCKRGGFISPLAYFNPAKHGIMPKAVEGGEPDQWLALQVARAAFDDAGYGDEIPEHKHTAVVIGKGTYLNRGNLSAAQHGIVTDQTLDILKTLHPELTAEDLKAIRRELKQHLPPFNADTASGLIPNVLAGRIANRLDLMGPSYTVDAACASSLIAVDIAMRDLQTGRCDLALVGGSHVVTPVPVLMLFCQLGALSRRQEIRPFDKKADGTILGEGVGMVVLKRRADAERDGNRIYAFIKGVGTASDGRGLSVMAPRLEGEVEAIARAYRSAGVSPNTIGLIEAHGTATSVGDTAEVRALAQVFGEEARTSRRIGLGSVKSMISHLMPAAGIAALIKTALALYHRVLPPTLHVDEPNPELHLEKTPFYINTETRPWIHGSQESLRRAAVSAFGFGGINAHVVLEEADLADAAGFRSRQLSWDTEVLLLYGSSREDILEQVRALAMFLERAPGVVLRDLAYTLNTTRANAPGSTCLAIVASSIPEVQDKLDRALKKLSDPQVGQIKTRDGVYWTAQPLNSPGAVAFLFPGEGSQYVNMLADLCIHFPEVRAQFDLIDRIFAGHARNFVPSDYLFPPPAFASEAQNADETRIWQMECAVEAVLTANRALTFLLDRLHVRPSAVVGHSTGEYSAMLASGMIRADDESTLREFALGLNNLHQESAGDSGIPAAALLAVAGDSGHVAATIAEGEEQLFIAMANCPHQTVIAGPEAAIARAAEKLHAAGLITERLPFDRPYHTPQFEGAAKRLEPFFARWLVAGRDIVTYSCTTAAPFPTDLVQARQIAVDHWLRPVAFSQTIEAMYADGVRIFIEVGSKGNLSAFVDDILRGRPHVAVPADVIHRSGITQLNHLVALLAIHAVPMQLDYLYRHRTPVKLDLERPEDPYHAGPTQGVGMKLPTGWPAMHLSETSAQQLLARPEAGPLTSAPDSSSAVSMPVPEWSAPIPATRTFPRTLSSEPAPVAAEQVLSAHFSTMERFLTTQQDVMQAYLAQSSPGNDPPTVGSTRPDDEQLVSSPAASSTDDCPLPQATAPLAADQSQRSDGINSPPGSALSADAASAILVRLVSERTGYPAEMLELNLDLEANLGIDSIKRVEILGAFRKEIGLGQPSDMEALASAKTLQAIINLLSSSEAGSHDHVPAVVSPPTVSKALHPGISVLSAPVDPGWPASLPLLGRVIAYRPGKELTARYEINPEEHRFLLDHTLGRHVSVEDPELRGLPVMPLTMSMELLAETAAALAPGLLLTGMRDVRATRWIIVDREPLTLELIATREEGGPEERVHVQLYEASAGNGSERTMPIVEGTMLYAGSYPAPPALAPFAPQDAQPSKWTSDQLYSEVMFHGPTFRGVVSIDRTGSDGTIATLLVLHKQGLLRSLPQPALIIDPVLLDQPGQVVGFWTAEHLDTGRVIFPFHLRALHFYAAMPEAGRRLECRARIDLIGDLQVRSDLDVVDPDRGLLLRFEHWEDRRFELPGAFFRFLMSPRDVMLSQPWLSGEQLQADPGHQLYRVDLDAFAEDFFTSSGGIWQQMLAGLILSRRERVLWHSLTKPERQRVEWLLGRLAAKDAVRSSVKERHGLVLAPADIEILPDNAGRPVVAGNWLQRLGVQYQVSIAHTARVAIAGASDSVAGIGVDVEHAEHMRAEVSAVAFTSYEQALLHREGLPSEELWPLRLWCAKEAAAKAVGYGMQGGPQSLEAKELDPACGVVEIALTGALLRMVPQASGSILSVGTARQGEFIAALSVLHS